MIMKYFSPPSVKFNLVVSIILLLLFAPVMSLAGMPLLEPMQVVHPGFIVMGEVGVATLHHTDTSAVNVTGQYSDIDLDAQNAFNFVGGAGIGWRFNSLFSLMLSYLYASFDLTSHSILETSAPSSSFGTAKGTSNMLLLNGFVDLATLFRLAVLVHPYVGVGLGVSWNRLSDLFAITNSTILIPPLNSSSGAVGQNNTRTDFAYRIILGFSYILMHRMLLFVQYSYLCAGKYEPGNMVRFVSGPGAGFTETNRVIPNGHVDMHLFTVGLSFMA